MPPKNYYEIKEEAFLFKKEKTPEESVRQWLIFELMITYGYSINQIEIELPIKYGTKTGFADIVVYKENLPLIVIECKRREENKLEKHLEQAKSYAAAPEIKAEFAVYTNGDKWLVQRNINNQWTNCIDIPNFRTITQGLEIDTLLYEFDNIRPLLYWLHKRIPQTETNMFLCAMQVFFRNYPKITKGTEHNLLAGLDRLLRPKWHENTSYRVEKLCVAFSLFMTYLESKGEDVGGIKETFLRQEKYSDADVRDMLLIPNIHFHELTNTSKNIHVLDIFAVRLIISLLSHIQSQLYVTGKSIELDDTVSQEFFNYLEAALKLNFNIELPDKLHKGTLDILYEYCEKDWLKHKSIYK